jgi:L-alanine-DL-glutamate epimerase-like enolase superfamily enzyme
VRVATNKGVVGWGECGGFSGAAAVAAVEIVRRVAVGQDPTDPETSASSAAAGSAVPRDRTRDQQPRYATSAQARRRLRVQTLGGPKRTRVETYASLISAPAMSRA